MPRQKGMTSINILMSPENNEKIKEFATQQGFKIIVDYIRHLIEVDMKAKGADIDLSVNRGGYRIRNEDKDNDE
jgi:hypothetical protein